MESETSQNNLNPLSGKENSYDEIINELIQNRKIQQEALMKIMTSIERTEPNGEN